MIWRCLTAAAFTVWLTACGVTQPQSVPLNGACFATTDCLTPFQCVDATCQLPAATVCVPQAKRCNGSSLEVCAATGSSWTVEEKCALGCVGGSAPACLEAPCTAGQRACDGTFVMECLSDGSAWTLAQSCSTTCVDDGSTVDCAPESCQPFTTRCKAGEPATLQTCNSRGTEWVDSACEGLAATDSTDAVPGACAAGRCALAVCVPGSERCLGALVEECREDGTGWSAREQCAHACVQESDLAACAEAICVPHAARCLDATTREVCNSQGTAWTPVSCASNGEERCAEGQCLPRQCEVVRDDRGFVLHRDTRCDGDVLQACDDTEAGFEPVEACAFGCAVEDGEASCRAPACAEGEQRCDGHTLLRCTPDRSALGLLTYCAAGCVADEVATPPQASCEVGSCPPLSRVCDTDFGGTHFVALCSADGAGYERLEDCPDGCSNGRCRVSDNTCTPGEVRCKPQDEVEICVATGGTTRWQFSERCLAGCTLGTCDRGGTCGCPDGEDSVECGSATRAPFAVHALLPTADDPVTPADDTKVPCDPRSTVLAYTDVIRGRLGAPVPDGTLVTFTHDGADALFASTDADPAQAGLQRPTLHGRAMVRVRAPDACPSGRTLQLTASLGGRCLGGGVVPFAAPLPTEGASPPTRLVFVAEDFSTTDAVDSLNTTATVDTATGAALAPAEFDEGSGADGDLTLAAGQTLDLAQQGWARFWEVLSLGARDVTVDAHLPNLTMGDEVLLTTLWGNSTSYPGQFEFKRVASVDGGRVTFTQPIERQYAPEGAEVSTDFRVVLQRVPHFRNVTIPAGAKLTTTAMIRVGTRNAGGTGIVAFRAAGDVTVLGSIDVQRLGYAAGTQYSARPNGSPAINKLLVGTSAAGPNAGAIYLHARRVTFQQDGVFAPATARINANAFDDAVNAGQSGTVWVAAGQLEFGSTTRVVANDGTHGLVRLDWGRLDNTTNPAAPTAYFGQRGALTLQTTRVFEESASQTPQLSVTGIRVMGLVAGTADTQVAVLAPADAPATMFPALSLSASTNDGATWTGLGAGPATVPAGRQLRWKAGLVADESGTLRLRGVALQLHLQ